MEGSCDNLLVFLFVNSVAIGNSVVVNSVCGPVGVVKAVTVLKSLVSLWDPGEPLALYVGVEPEVKEQSQEDQSINANDVDEDWELVWAVQEKVLADMNGHH